MRDLATGAQTADATVLGGPATTAHAQPAKPRLEFTFADGLRALAALTITVYHAYLYTGRRGEAERNLPSLKVLSLGDFAVPMFIVLSGFVLMLPVARTATLVFRGGHWDFFRRRARRILPPYYAAIALFLVMIAVIPIMNEPTRTQWDSKIPVTERGVVSHLLLIHNLRPQWAFKIDGPAWSVATEWQIYLLMPFLLLPVWRGLGAKAGVVVAVFAGWSVHLLWPQLDAAHLWYLGLFAMGMAAAHVVARDVAIPRLGLLTAASVLAVVAGFTYWFDEVHDNMYLAETGLGIAMGLVLAWMGQRSMQGRPTFWHAVLGWRPLVWIGLWSYSLYLVHSPLLGLGNILVLKHAPGLSIKERFLVEVVVVLPLALVASYVFHRLVERRFMNTHQRAVVAHQTATEKA